MLIVFARNLVMVTDGTPVVVRTDPVPMHANDRVNGLATAAYIQGLDASMLGELEASMNGVDFELVGGAVTLVDTQPTHAALMIIMYPFLRAKYTFQATGSAVVCFSHYANVDHS
jgi:hypothetical protein